MANQAQTISLNKQFNEFSPAPWTMAPTPGLRGFILYNKDRDKNNPTAPTAKFFTGPTSGAQPPRASVPPGVSEDTSGRIPSDLAWLHCILSNIKDTRNESQFQKIKNICSKNLRQRGKRWLKKGILIPIR